MQHTFIYKMKLFCKDRAFCIKNKTKNAKYYSFYKKNLIERLFILNYLTYLCGKFFGF